MVINEVDQSETTWEELGIPELVRNGLKSSNFTRPSQIQALSLNFILKGTNVIAQAPNGCGKTGCFAITLLSLCDPTGPTEQGLCISPTRELALQNLAVIQMLGQFCNFTYFAAVSQCAAYEPSHIIVATPGKIIDFMRRRTLDFNNSSIVVIDEADVMLNPANNMGPQLAKVLAGMPKDSRVCLFSATYPDDVRQFCMSAIPNAQVIEVKKEDLILQHVQQFHVACRDNKEKLTKLKELYECMTVGQSVIFLNQRKTAVEIKNVMEAEGHACSVIIGGNASRPGADAAMNVDLREQVMQDFRSGATKVLIATNLIARGIDVPAVTLVINFELPTNRDETIDLETYLHRVGRTGRFGLKGVALNFIDGRESILMKQAEQYFQYKVEPLQIDYDNLANVLSDMRL